MFSIKFHLGELYYFFKNFSDGPKKGWYNIFIQNVLSIKTYFHRISMATNRFLITAVGKSNLEQD